MKRLTQANKSGLVDYLMTNELNTCMMLSNLLAGGIDESDGLRAGEYFCRNDSVLAVYNSGDALAYVPDDGAIESFCDVLAEKRVRFFSGTPERNIKRISTRINKKQKRLVIPEICAISKDFPPLKERRGYALQRLFADDRESFEEFTQIYNAAQNDDTTVEENMRLASEARGLESFYLGRYYGEACFSAATQYQTQSYIVLGRAGVSQERRGYKLASITLCALAREMLMRGLTPITFTTQSNEPSYASVVGRGFAPVSDAVWLFVWYL